VPFSLKHIGCLLAARKLMGRGREQLGFFEIDGRLKAVSAGALVIFVRASSWVYLRFALDLIEIAAFIYGHNSSVNAEWPD